MLDLPKFGDLAMVVGSYTQIPIFCFKIITVVCQDDAISPYHKVLYIIQCTTITAMTFFVIKLHNPDH